ncbi:MFS transporter [Klebsiella pneumoniae]|uniref:MFS transporter n=1 Tax=Klebsiella pneumoniae TaxID=573 RepID=A0A377V228_KLEPN|nr:MFS transporter [Klebsiella pneumoniae]
MKINFPLLALAIGAFGIGTTEFSPMGLLPVIAKGGGRLDTGSGNADQWRMPSASWSAHR